MAAAIHPNTGMDLMAAPTILNDPARVMFDNVPALFAAVLVMTDAVSASSAMAAWDDAPTLDSLAAALASVVTAFAP